MSVSNTTKRMRTKYFSERASVLMDLGYLACKVDDNPWHSLFLSSTCILRSWIWNVYNISVPQSLTSTSSDSKIVNISKKSSGAIENSILYLKIVDFHEELTIFEF